MPTSVVKIKPGHQAQLKLAVDNLFLAREDLRQAKAVISHDVLSAVPKGFVGQITQFTDDGHVVLKISLPGEKEEPK